MGSEQQFVPEVENGVNSMAKPKNGWYCIVEKYEKEDLKNDESSLQDDQDDSIQFHQFFQWKEANEKWKKVTKDCKLKKGRAAALFDCKNLIKLKATGNNLGIEECVKMAKEKGIYANRKEEEVSVTDTVLMLYKLLSTKSDFYMMLWVMILLGASTYLDLESQLLTGQVMGLVGDMINGTRVQENWYARKACDYLVKCDGGSSIDYYKALIIGFVILKVMERLLYVMNVWFHHNACDKKNYAMRMKAFEHVLSLDQAYFDTHSAAAIRGSMNVHSINNLITWNIPYLITLTLQLFMTGVYMLRVDYRLGGLAIAGYMIIKFCLLKPCEKIERRIHQVEHKLGMMNSQIISETFDLIMSIKLFSKENHHIDDYNLSNERALKNLKFVVFLRCFREFVNGVSQFLIFGGVTYYGIIVLQDENTRMGDLPAFLLLIRSFRELFGRIKWHIEVLAREFADIERFIELMKEKPAVISGKDKMPRVEGEIEFKDVSFEYPSRPGEQVLKNLSLRIAPQKITAIVGDSGAGKSTISKLLMRLYDPQKGSIILDGKDIKEIDTQNLHALIGIVNQNPDLFNAPLSDNIGYGFLTKNYNHSQIEAASEIANCGFISKFRGKFDTFAGARGSNLSGGQKQRLAIARAAIRDPSVLILDEATSSLDAENEALVQHALENVMKNRTILVIAHRLSTIKNADHIICMKDGEVVEQGTHSMLMSKRGIYFNLVNTQIVEDVKNPKG